ncbi:MAG TPA: hypothetical protein VN843_25260 [Anaerolineales bacterium]|nr:hypothetical protein [Anaerolineales bacterium]
MFKTILSNWLIPAIALTFVWLAVALFAPGWVGLTAGILIFLIVAMALFGVVQKQTKLYREKRINRITLVRNVLYEVMGILLAMIVAFVIGRYITEIATEQIGNGLIRFIAAIVISLLAGMSVGFLVKQTWSRLAKQ